MTRPCQICATPAVVVLADHTGDQLDVCATHHQAALRASGGELLGIGLTTTIPTRLPAAEAAARWARVRRPGR